MKTRVKTDYPRAPRCPFRWTKQRGLWEGDCCFSSKDNRAVILTRQDFLPHRTADGDLLFTFSSNILEVFCLIEKLARGTKTHRVFIVSRAASRKSRSARFKNSFSNVKLVSEVKCSKSSNICLIRSRSSLKRLKDIKKNAISMP